MLFSCEIQGTKRKSNSIFFNIRERKSDKVTKKKSDDNYFIGKVSVSEKKYSIGKTVT